MKINCINGWLLLMSIDLKQKERNKKRKDDQRKWNVREIIIGLVSIGLGCGCAGCGCAGRHRNPGTIFDVWTDPTEVGTCASIYRHIACTRGYTVRSDSNRSPNAVIVLKIQRTTTVTLWNNNESTMSYFKIYYSIDMIIRIPFICMKMSTPNYTSQGLVDLES